MAYRCLDRAGATVALAALMSVCLIVPSRVDAQGTADVAAKKKVEQFLGTSLPGKSTVHFVDLNGDGVLEALVVSDDPQDCGSHGCAASVLDLRGASAKDIGSFIGFDLLPLSSRTRGWRDLSLVGGRGAARVRFNGQAYSIESSPVAAAPPGPPPEGPCLTTTSNANASKLAGECKAVSGINKQCNVNVSCTDIERQIVAGCELARKTGRRYQQFCSNYPANLGLPDD